MSTFRKFIAAVGVSAIIGVGALSVQPAIAQEPNDNGYDPGWHTPDWRSYQDDRGWRPRDDYGYGYGYGYGYRPSYDDPAYGGPDYGGVGPDIGGGVTELAICPGGYHLGRSGRLCWPNRG